MHLFDSHAYRAFTKEFLAAPTWESRKNGFPSDVLDALNPDEKIRAAGELIKQLLPGDDWPIQAVGHLRSEPALPHLRRLLDQTTGNMKANVALSIWQIAKDPAMCAIVIKESIDRFTDDDKSPKTFAMIDIVHSLAHFPQPEARARLKELETCKNFLIAYNSKLAQKSYKPE